MLKYCISKREQHYSLTKTLHLLAISSNAIAIYWSQDWFISNQIKRLARYKRAPSTRIYLPINWSAFDLSLSNVAHVWKYSIST
jgi:hypothetical protein